MMNSKASHFIFAFLAIILNGCQSSHKTLELPAHTSLYDLPEEEGGKVIHVTERKLTCHIETTRVLKLFSYYKLNCDGLSGWITDGDQK